MHMSDPLLSVPVGLSFWAVSGVLLGRVARNVSNDQDSSKVPLTGVAAAFVFAAQMINFSIPATGSSGHLAGGLLLTILLRPSRAFLAMASVLTIQCIFFADGGLLALGCNLFNLAFFPAFIAYPLIYRPLVGRFRPDLGSIAATSIAAIAGLSLGAISIALQLAASGKADIPLKAFLGFMLPIHLAIGLVEGVLTWSILSFIYRTQPGLLRNESERRFSVGFFAAAAIVTAFVGGVLSWFASEHPDGLEWSLAQMGIASSGGPIYGKLSGPLDTVLEYGTRWLPNIDPRANVTISGLGGSLLVLLAAGAAGMFLRRHALRNPDSRP